MERATRETWAKRIKQWKASGQPATEYAATVGVRPRTLSWWAWNLSAKSRSARLQRKRSRPTAVAMTKVAPQVSPLTFVEMTSASSTEGLEVVLPTTIRIVVRPGFDDRTLVRLLDVLERR